jgi:hypothetical protein
MPESEPVTIAVRGEKDALVGSLMGGGYPVGCPGNLVRRWRHENPAEAAQALQYVTFLTIGYMIARGLAKSGSRNRYDDNA